MSERSRNLATASSTFRPDEQFDCVRLRPRHRSKEDEVKEEVEDEVEEEGEEPQHDDQAQVWKGWGHIFACCFGRTFACIILVANRIWIFIWDFISPS